MVPPKADVKAFAMEKLTVEQMVPMMDILMECLLGSQMEHL